MANPPTTPSQTRPASAPFQAVDAAFRPKGVVLAGGNGTRLLPMTRVTNKHLLPVYDRPMVYYPLQCLHTAGIDEVLLVTGGNQAGGFVELLGNGREFGLQELAYAYQEGAGGIAQALSLAEDFADGRPLVVVLGDNLIEGTIVEAVNAFTRQLEVSGGRGGRILLKEVDDPERFGVACFEGNEPIASESNAGAMHVRPRLTEIVEKPKGIPPSRFAVIGIYMYDATVFDIIRTLTPSGRNELEITDVNNAYLRRGELEWSVVDGWWSDAGTVDSLYRAARLVAEHGVNGAPPVHARSAGESDLQGAR